MFVFLHPHARVKRKDLGYFSAIEYAHAYCRISSYQQLMTNKGYNPLIAIQIGLAGEAHKVWG
jgi:transposase